MNAGVPLGLLVSLSLVVASAAVSHKVMGRIPSTMRVVPDLWMSIRLPLSIPGHCNEIPIVGSGSSLMGS